MSSKIKVDTIENVAGSGNVSLGSGHNLVVPGNVTGQGTLAVTGNTTVGGTFGVTGNTTVGGTLVNTGLVTASAGVAIGGTGSANTLDDYEEGTWTPSFGGNTTYHNQAGKYTKIGRTVYVSGIIQANVLGTGSTTTVSGFPFATSNAGGGYATGDVGFHYFLAVNVFDIKLLMGNNSTVTGFQAKTSGSGTSSSALAVFGNGARVDFTVVYDVS